MHEDLDLSSIADERARQLVQQLLNVLEDVMADLRAAQAENQRLRDELTGSKASRARLRSRPTRRNRLPRTTPRNRNGVSRRPGRKTAKRTGLPSTGSRWCRSIRPTCRQMPCSRDTRTWWYRT